MHFLPLLTLVSFTIPSAPEPLSSDPLTCAISAVASKGQAQPENVTIRIAEQGELAPSTEAHTSDPDSEGNQVIRINPDYLAIYDSPESKCGYLTAILFHEYQHTSEYGSPSIAPETGYGNDYCSHLDIWESALLFLCGLIAELIEQGHTEAADELCILSRAWTGVVHGQHEKRLEDCPSHNPTPGVSCNC